MDKKQESYFNTSEFEGWWKFYPSGAVSGWIIPKNGTTHASIYIETDNYRSNVIEADEPREHLSKKKLGGTKYGFRHRLPPSAFNGKAITINIIDARSSGIINVIHCEAGVYLGEVTKKTSHQRTAKPLPLAKYEGWVGNISSGRISGWIRRKDSSESPLSIRISVGNYMSEELLADESRIHLKERGIGTEHGFSINLPASVEIIDNPNIRVLLPDLQPTGIEAEASSLDNTRKSNSRETKSKFLREKQEDAILLWCPISSSGLTTQLRQVTNVLRKLKIKFYISYHVSPTIDHPDINNWIDPRDINPLKAVIFFERFVPFSNGFDGAYKVFYVNLDWLFDSAIPKIKSYADVIIAPVEYRLSYLGETFPRQKIIHLPWPSLYKVKFNSINKGPNKEIINILYMGNDFNKESRKHPREVVEAILKCENDNLRFTLKFRSALPAEIRSALDQCALVEAVHEKHMDTAEVAELYGDADVCLMPNECEGNGLTILEAWEYEAVPAVLDGSPMNCVTDDSNAFMIECSENGWREKTPQYRMEASSLLRFFDKMERHHIEEKRTGVRRKKLELRGRSKRLESAIRSICFEGAGIRTRSRRELFDQAHKMKPGSNRIRGMDLIFGAEQKFDLFKKADHIHILLTTSRRPEHLKVSLPRIIEAMNASEVDCSLFVFCDGFDKETVDIIDEYRTSIHHVSANKERFGLPYAWNCLLNMSNSEQVRFEKRADYVMYIQDDCCIMDTETFIDTMVDVADAANPEFIGFVSGFHTEVHPGYGSGEFNSRKLILSDSIDGKNFMGRPRLLNSIGPLTWWFKDGMRRGNPGPIRGSHFDLWQWKESPNATSIQNRINIIIPGLADHMAKDSNDSTWGNDTSEQATEKRKKSGKIYNTRETQP